MKKRLKPFYLALRFILGSVWFAVFAGTFLNAQDVPFIATAEPNVLRVGEQFTISYESNQKIADIELPAFDNFQSLGGPSVGQSTQIESSPGKTYTKTTYTYTYYFRAVKEGKFTIAPASARIKNKSIQSNALTIEVLGSQSSGTSTQGQQEQGNANSSDNTSGDVFVKLILNKKEAYIGEQIVATVKLYTKLQISGIDQRYKGPDFTGFFTEPIEIPPLRNLERENVNGDIYYTGILQKVLLIPQKTGDLVIPPFDLDLSIRQQVKRKPSNNFFDEFFEPSTQDIPMKLKSNRVVVRSKALPTGKPATFTGAVGSFTLQTSVDKTHITTNDAVNYKIAIRGTGNYKIVDEPVLNFPPDIEKYDPVIKTAPESPMTGTKTFEYLLIPHYAGEFTVPPVEFTYFDLQSNQFKTIRSSSHTIQVEKGKGDTLLPVISGMAKEDVKLLSSDIQYIKLKTARQAFRGLTLVKDLRFYLLYLLLTLVAGLVLWLKRNHIRRTRDVVLVKNRKANKYARKRLKKAAGMIHAENKNAFYDELLSALWLYLSDKLSIPMADLSKENASSVLNAHHVKGETVDKMFDIISTCELARYAPATEAVNAGQLLDEAVKLIVRLQQELG
jgi:BatD DUF11 like domain